MVLKAIDVVTSISSGSGEKALSKNIFDSTLKSQHISEMHNYKT